MAASMSSTCPQHIIKKQILKSVAAVSIDMNLCYVTPDYDLNEEGHLWLA